MSLKALRLEGFQHGGCSDLGFRRGLVLVEGLGFKVQGNIPKHDLSLPLTDRERECVRERGREREREKQQRKAGLVLPVHAEDARQ